MHHWVLTAASVAVRHNGDGRTSPRGGLLVGVSARVSCRRECTAQVRASTRIRQESVVPGRYQTARSMTHEPKARVRVESCTSLTYSSHQQGRKAGTAPEPHTWDRRTRRDRNGGTGTRARIGARNGKGDRRRPRTLKADRARGDGKNLAHASQVGDRRTSNQLLLPGGDTQTRAGILRRLLRSEVAPSPT